ncbi:hypothetical protein KC19_7G085900 [Ceratodon purpureus]|uniref:Uncharacterized protein n=1 Tax=Ceratodon purpureus TaxID=3225 RepID=A0A8T0H927_CERPU|nr:hypothetical protein KC19_7G085900 [Ceratodon purpureus]
MKTWSVCALSNCGHRVDISGLRKQQHQDQLARIAVFLLVFTFCCPLHAQNDDYVSSNTNVITIDTKVVISAPLAVFTKSLDIFTTGIPIHPVYIQAPSDNSGSGNPCRIVRVVEYTMQGRCCSAQLA